MAEELQAAIDANADSTAPVELDSSIGRLSRMDAIQSQQIALELKTRQQQSLFRVQNAIKAILRGKYGLCRRCGQPISLERLEAAPDAVVCVNCAA